MNQIPTLKGGLDKSSPYNEPNLQRLFKVGLMNQALTINLIPALFRMD